MVPTVSQAGDAQAGSGAPGPRPDDDDAWLPGLAEAPEAKHIDPHDRVPAWLRRAHTWAMAHVPASNRRRLAAALGLVGVLLATFVAVSRVLRFVFPGLDMVAYAGLFVVNWLGAGGLLVPIPGLRIVGWLMIVQQGAALDPLLAGVVGGLAMALGQISYYVAANAGAHRARPAGQASARPSLMARVMGAERAARLKERIVSLINDHGFATVLALSLVPNPLTTFACITAGAVGMGFRRFVVATLIGRLALGLLLAAIGDGLFDSLSPIVSSR